MIKKTEQLFDQVTQNRSPCTDNQSNNQRVDEVDKELLHMLCQSLSPEEIERLDDCTIDFLGQNLLTEEEKQALDFNASDFLNQMNENL